MLSQRKNIKSILTILLFGLTLTVKSQIQQFEYIGEYDKSFNFTSTRTFHNDSIFTDSGLLCSEDTSPICAIMFKKVNSIWYIKADSTWQEFFNPKDSLIKVVYFKSKKFILKPLGHSLTHNGIKLFGFVHEELYVYSGHTSNLWFEPNLGVVIIEGNEILTREDFRTLKRK